MGIGVDREERSSPLPFDRYEGAGRTLLRAPKWGDGTARHGYGLPVFGQCGYCCAYCGLDMLSSFEAWLQLSVDHVVPKHSIGLDYPKDWIEDVANLVTCCGPCNALGNRFKVDVEAPSTLAEFFDLRDRVFRERKVLILGRRAAERAHYQAQLGNAQASGRDGVGHRNRVTGQRMKVRIQWMPNEPGLSSSTRDEDGLRELFGQAEADRILHSIRSADDGSVTLMVSGPDAGFEVDRVEARFSEVGPYSTRSKR